MKRKVSRFKAPRVNTVIGDSTKIVGDISFSGGLHVDGAVQGNIAVELDDDTGSALTVSAKGTVTGEVRVPNLILDGTINGDVYASQRVELAEHASVNGNLHYQFLEMALGATVNGNLLHSADMTQRRLGYDDTEKKTKAGRGGTTESTS
ncbi:MAG: polymer-forming cytoskeletal protein [Chromatiales bacterium]|nr:polymer-forming cytoskeletal protein [Chromatiales bacterium]